MSLLRDRSRNVLILHQRQQRGAADHGDGEEQRGAGRQPPRMPAMPALENKLAIAGGRDSLAIGVP